MEDDKGLARLLEKRLARTGIHLEVVSNGADGLKKCEEVTFDVVLVDNQMPGMTGIEVIQHLAVQENTPPVIMVTGSGDEHLAVEAMKSGASDYIVKDTGGKYLDSVAAKISEVLTRHHLRMERKAREQAKEEQIRDLDSFASTVAHDLKAPIHQVKGLLDLLSHSRQNERDFLRFSQLLADSASKMETIVDELLLLSRVDAADLELGPVDMSQVLEHVIDRLEIQLREAKASIFVAEDLPGVYGHAGWIEEVWVNYISNAIKYGGTPPLIEIGATPQQDGTLAFWVRDNGTGLDLAQQAKLFVPFSRPGNSTQPGHGLGLSIVKRIIEKLDGTVGVSSTPGAGSTFSFTLPVLPVAQVAAGVNS
jgi:two-component system, sensor histidine kinase and response regulator